MFASRDYETNTTFWENYRFIIIPKRTLRAGIGYTVVAIQFKDLAKQIKQLLRLFQILARLNLFVPLRNTFKLGLFDRLPLHIQITFLA